VVYRTDQDGLITVRSDGYRLHVETTTSPAAESSGSPAGRTNRP
jgi:beta-lactamase superfamily II metal-dependent hydrolase